MKKKTMIFVIFFVLLFAVGCGLTVGNPSFSLDRIEDENTDYTEIESDLTKAVQNAMPSCVGVYAKGSTTASIGSGVIYKIIDVNTGETMTDKTVDGLCYVVTNEHVVNTKDSRAKYSVYLGNEVYIKADLVGTDSTNDLAVLTFTTNVKTYNVSPIAGFYGEGDENSITDIANPGEMAFAIGCPISFEYFNYVSYGNVAAVNLNEVKHTAAINPGNSGGGLFNIQGRLLGINVRKVVGIPDGDDEIPTEGLAEAIPVWIVRNSVEDIEALKKNVVRPTLGIETRNVNTGLYPEDGHLLPNIMYAGVVVTNVIENGNGSLAGLQPLDVIVNLKGNKGNEVIDNVDVIRSSDINYFMNNTKKDDDITITVYRNYNGEWKKEELKVELK